MHYSNSGIKQWPLAGSLVTTHGKQIIGPSTVMYDCVADGLGGWVSRPAIPATRHEVREHSHEEKDMPESLLQVLVHRDGISIAEARELIAEAKQEVAEGADPEDVLEDMGLEPDYFYDLL